MLIECPPRLDEQGFENLVGRIARQPGTPAGIDLSGLRFADPFGLLGLLCIGLSATFRRGQAWGLVLPRSAAVRSHWERCGAMEHLAQLFILEEHPGPAGAAPSAGPEHPWLLGVVLIREGGDVPRTVARLKGRADVVLVSRLGYHPLEVDRFTVAIAELCRNIVDHSGCAGAAAAQYFPGGAGGTPEVRLAVCDAGIGIAGSLAPRYAARHPGTWDDGTALRLAVRRGVSRCEDPGRGLGLAAVAQAARQHRWHLRLRSGTAAHQIGRREPKGPASTRLAPFPGTQVGIRVPHIEGAGARATP